MNARDYTEIGYRTGAARIGIDPSEYRAKREAGYRWCSEHRGWHREDAFRVYPNCSYPLRSYCITAERDRAREYQRRKRAAWKRGTA